MLNRRDILRLTAAGASLAFMPIARAADGTPVRGGHLVSIVVPEPQNLGIAVSNPTIVIAANIFDGLVTMTRPPSPGRNSPRAGSSRRTGAPSPSACARG
jgi:peptide/nickel transport system substrate-binding protein